MNTVQVTVEFVCRCCARSFIIRRRPSGLPTTRCEDCRKEAARMRARKWFVDNPERHRALQIKWHANNGDKARAYAREWAKRNRGTGNKNWHNYHARKLKAFVEVVDRDVLFLRDDGICGICGEPVDRGSGWHIDHVVPLARGGEHSYANTQVAHATCNWRKSDRLISGLPAGVTP